MNNKRKLDVVQSSRTPLRLRNRQVPRFLAEKKRDISEDDLLEIVDNDLKRVCNRVEVEEANGKEDEFDSRGIRKK